MSRLSVQVSAGALLLLALLYYLSDGPWLAALLPPVAAHEAGHLLALRLLGLRVKSLRLDLRGLCIDYIGQSGPAGHALAAAAGPAAGLLYALAAARLGLRLGSETLTLSAGLSLLLSLFNLLPAMPLDGGRIARELLCLLCGQGRGERLSAALSGAAAATVCGLGLWLLSRGGGAALALAGLLLLLSQLSPQR